MVVTPGFALYERFSPYVTCHVLSRVHTRLPLDRSAYALRHTLFIIDLAHTEILSSFPFVLTVDTSDLHHLTSSSRHILSSTTSSSRLPSSSSSGLPFKDNTLSSGLPSRTTLSIIFPTNIISHRIYIIYQVHQDKNNFIGWIAIKDTTCQSSHVFIFIK